jgi:heat shock protein HslJ
MPLCRFIEVTSTPQRPSGTTAVLRGLVLSGALALGACVSPPAERSPPVPTLVGSEWRLVDLSGRPALENVEATLAFPEPGRMSGSGSCNRFTGSVSTDTNLHMQMGQIATTRMACPGAVGEQESRYLAALQQVHHFEQAAGQLLLYVQGQNLPLRFVRTRP